MSGQKTVLLYSTDDLLGGRRYDNRLRAKTGADVAIYAVGRKDRHARPIRYFDTRLFAIGLAVEYCDIILSAHADPNLLAVRREKCLVR